MIPLILFLLLSGAGPASECKDCSDIKVVVTGFRNDKGEGLLALYSGKDGYPLDASKAINRLKAPIQDAEATFELKGVKPGSYALIAMHDENKNGRLDRNLLGMPREGYGASNDPRMPTFGPPTYESAMFTARSGEMTMTIPLHYYPH
jgi:uncharacterized protein (DUF2141 family)